MPFFAFFLLQLLAHPPQAEPVVLSVAAARAQGAGATVTLRAVVLNGAELGQLRFVQDDKTGLALYSRPEKVAGYDALQAGDSIQVTGTLKYFNGLLELDRITALQKLAADRRLQPLLVPAATADRAFSEANEGRLLEIADVAKLAPATGGTPVLALAPNTNYRVANQAEAQVRVSGSATALAGLALPTSGPFNVRGVLSKYAPGGGSGGYQLLPRQAADVLPGGGHARITEAPVPVDVQPMGCTLVFATLNPGDTRVRYGLSRQDLKYSATDPTFTTKHRISLANLIAGATYYVEVSSRNAAGTEVAPAVPVILSKAGKRDRNRR